MKPLLFYRAILLALIILLGGCGNHVYHKVRHGDTLYSIGWHYGQDYRDIARWNHLDSSFTIRQGQWLRVAMPLEEGNKSSVIAKIETNVAASPQPSKPIVKPEKLPRKALAIREKTPVRKPAVPRYQPPVTASTRWSWPVRGKILTRFNQKKPGGKGIDISGRVGTNINAALGGEVVYSGGGLKQYGQLVIIKHNQSFLSAYGYNSALLVKEGDRVRKGQAIAKMGRNLAGEPRLHFEIRKDGKPVDPVKLLQRR